MGTFTTIGNSCIGHLRGEQGIVRSNINCSNNTFEADILVGLINPNPFLTFDYQITVGQYLVNRDGNTAAEAIALAAATLTTKTLLALTSS